MKNYTILDAIDFIIMNTSYYSDQIISITKQANYIFKVKFIDDRTCKFDINKDVIVTFINS